MDRNKPIHPLQTLRKKLSLSQADLASLVQVSPTLIAHYECNYRKVPDRIFTKCCEIFNLNAEDFDKVLKKHDQDTLQYLLNKAKAVNHV